MIAVLAICTLLSLFRNAVWMDDGTLWQDSTSKSPGKYRNYNELALHALEKHQPEQALLLFTRALQSSPKESIVYSNMGLAYEQLRQWDDSLRMYQRAIALDPRRPAPYYNIGRIYYAEFNKPDAAFPWFLKARDLNPNEPDVHLYLGYICRDRGDQANAEREYELYRSLKE